VSSKIIVQPTQKVGFNENARICGAKLLKMPSKSIHIFLTFFSRIRIKI
jgi:hypothetical protein